MDIQEIKQKWEEEYELEDFVVSWLISERIRLTSELAAAKEEIERLKEKARDCERRTFRYGEEAKEAEERAEAAESSLTSERKETERLREQLTDVAELLTLTAEQVKAALQSRQGEE